MSAVAQDLADAPRQETSQIVVRERSKPADGFDAGGTQPRLGLRADAGQPAHVERREEAPLLARHDDEETARLARVATDLRDDLAGRDPERAREARRGAHRSLHRFRHHARLEEVGRDLADVEIALVETGPLDRRHDLAHRRPHGLRVLAVEGVPRPYENRVGAAPERLSSRHRRVDPELPRFVVRSRDDASPMRIAADDERLRSQLRLLELLDGREESI